MARKITLDQFREAGVCSDGFMHFAGAFGHEIEVTAENCRRMAGKLNFAFGADVFLKTPEARAEFKRRMDAFNTEWEPRWKEARQKFEIAWMAAMNTSETVAALKVREVEEAPIRRAGEIAQALAFAHCYNMEE